MVTTRVSKSNNQNSVIGVIGGNMKDLSATSRKAVIAIMAISLVLLFGSMTAPLLEYIKNSYPDIVEGSEYLILTIPALVGMAVSFVIGPLAMKINMKYLMIVAALAAFVYFAIFALVGVSNFSLLLVGAGIVGICQGAAMVLTSSLFGAYITDAAARANYVAISGALMNGGGAIVNIVGGMIASGNGGADWPHAYYLGVLIIPAIVVFWFIMPKQPDPVESAAGPSEGAEGGPAAPSGFIPIKAFLMIALATFVFICLAGFLLNVSLYIVGELSIGATSSEAGLANALFTILGVVAGFTYPIISRFLKNWVAVLGWAFAACGMFMVVFLNTQIITIYVGACLLGLGFNIANPFVMAQIMAVTPPRWIPIAMSIMMGAMNLGMFLYPYIFGAISAPFGGTIASQMMLGGFGIAIGAALGVFLFAFAKKSPAPAVAE